MKKNTGALVALLLGVAIAVTGIVLQINGGKQLNAQLTISNDFSSSSEYAPSYSFGADFYTEMYGVTHDVLSQLNNLAANNANNFSRLNNNLVRSARTLYSAVCWLIIALGAGLCGIACIKLSRTESKEEATAKDALMKRSLAVNEQLLKALEKCSGTEAPAQSVPQCEPSAESTREEAPTAAENSTAADA